MKKLVDNIADLIKVKTIVTLAMTYAMIHMLLNVTEVAPELLALFSASYGAVITYFFTKNEVK